MRNFSNGQKKYSKTLVLNREGYGYLISNENVGNLKEYITEQAQKLTPTNVYKRVGWELDSDGRLCFKGYTLHSNTGLKARYKGNLDIQPQGTKDGFVKDVQGHILGHPTLELSMLLGLSSCLVGYLNCFTTMNTIVINIYGCSATGKTTSCNLAVSMCGNPFPGNNKQSLSSTWYGTENGKAAELAGNQGFTVLFDEFGMKDRKLDLSQFIYGLHSGKEKARATRTGDSATPRRWATTVLSSGEHSIFDTSTTADGLKVRVLNFGSITWTDSAEQAHEVDKFSRKYCALPIHLLADYLLTLDSSSVLERYHKLIDLPDSIFRKETNMISAKKKTSPITPKANACVASNDYELKSIGDYLTKYHTNEDSFVLYDSNYIKSLGMAIKNALAAGSKRLVVPDPNILR